MRRLKAANAAKAAPISDPHVWNGSVDPIRGLRSDGADLTALEQDILKVIRAHFQGVEHGDAVVAYHPAVPYDDPTIHDWYRSAENSSRGDMIGANAFLGVMVRAFPFCGLKAALPSMRRRSHSPSYTTAWFIVG